MRGLSLVWIFILSPFLVFAQVNINLKAGPSSLKHQLFFTKSIKTNSLKSKVSFGNYYLTNTKVGIIQFESPIEAALLKYVRQFEPKTQVPEIILNIQVFELYEKLGKNNSVDGEIRLELSALILTDGDSNSLCRTRSSSRYQRSLLMKNTDNIAAQVQVCIDNSYAYIVNYIKKNKGILENYAESSKVIIKPYKVVYAKDTVYYQQRKVTWADFNGPIRSRTDYGAAIFASFGYATKLYTDNSQISMEITPKIFMDKNMSWVRPGMKTEYALQHEQLHFDIAYVLSLQFLQKIKSFKAKTEKDLLSLVNYEYLEFYKKMHTVQEQYDDETDHSLNKEFQNKWSKKINAEIAAFDVNSLYR
jgi:hypothetical protein